MSWGWGNQPWGEDWGSTRSVVRLKRLGLRKSDFLKLIARYKTRVLVYPSYNRKSEVYDNYENNKTEYNLNPLPVKCYLRELTPQSLVFRNYGLQNIGAVELLLDNHYVQWFLICNKIEINGDEYEVFKNAPGQYNSINKGAFNLVSIVLYRTTGSIKQSRDPNKKLSDSRDFYLNSRRLLTDYGTNVLIYPVQKVKDETYDDYEKNYNNVFLNPIVIKAYVLSMRGLTNVLEPYGLRQVGSKQIITLDKHLDLFSLGGKIKIDGYEYQVFRETNGSSAVISKQPGGLIKVVIERI